MPKVPIDYANTIIYKLVHKDDLNDDNIYTGHTTDFICRKNLHKSDCTNANSKSYNEKKYKYIRENGGWDEWLMIEIEKYPCKDKPEAVARERLIQTEMKAKLNSVIAGRTNKEWRQDNREKLSERKKQYRQDNLDKISEHKKQYYQSNKEKILERQGTKITCDHCGTIILKNNIPAHKRTQKCINFKPV